jgi:hypothetical protein
MKVESVEEVKIILDDFIKRSEEDYKKNLEKWGANDTLTNYFEGRFKAYKFLSDYINKN